MARLFRDLIDRRVPHYGALYLGASWGVIEFVSLLEERYLLSPRLTDFCLLTLALLLPSVLLFAYHHGRPGRDELHRSEKIGIPLNLVAAGVVLWLVFGGEDLGAMTTTVQVRTEQGETVERVVPKAEYRKRIAVFLPEATGPDSASWMGAALMMALSWDLTQEPFVEVQHAVAFMEQLREAGFPADRAPPVGLARQIARESHLTHFTALRVQPDPAGGVRAEMTLYEVEPARRIAQVAVRAADVPAAADSLSLALRRQLDIPQSHIDEVSDLPVAEMLTSSTEALRAHARGVRAVLTSGWPEAIQHFERALALDSTFAGAAFDLFGAKLLSGDHDGAVAALDRAMEHLYRMPERLEYMVKANYYALRGDAERALSVLEMGREVYPDDATAHQMVGQYNAQLGRFDAAIAAYRRVLEIDPSKTGLLRAIGDLHRHKGEYGAALEWYERYAAVQPDNPAALRALGDLYRLQGRHAQARASYERALTLEPGDPAPHLSLARLARDVGELDRALWHLNAALEAAGTPTQRFQVEQARSTYYAGLGQPLRAITHGQAALSEADRALPPLGAMVQRLSLLDEYVIAGRTAEAERIHADLTARLPGPIQGLARLGRLRMELAREKPRPDSLERAADALERVAREQSWEFMKGEIAGARARAAEERGDCRRAVELYRAQLQAEPTNQAPWVDIARCHRRSGQPELALEAARRRLSVRPADAEALTELALALLDLDRRDEARRQLERAARIWDEAEPSFHPARRTREALASATGAPTG